MSTHTSEHGTLPLAPIDRPRNWLVRVMYLVTRRRFGRTPTAFRVIYARAPWIALVSATIAMVLERFLSIEPELRSLLQLSIAMRNNCTFCADLTRAEAVRMRMGPERFRDLLSFEGSASFSPREKAALAYAEALQQSLHIDDQLLARLRTHFNERQLVEIVWVCAVERYFNAMALPLRIGSDGLYSDG